MAISVPIVSTWNSKGVDQATRQLDKFERDTKRIADRSNSNFGKLADLGGRISKSFALIGVAAAGAAAVIGKSAIDAASDFAELQSKSSVIFGEQAATITAFGEAAAKAFGMSKLDAIEAATTFGTFGKAAGLTGDELAKFSTDLTGLAGDLASFGNATPEEAALALGAALRGESEPLRKFGVLLDDARLKQEALELGIYDGNGALTTQQKILAANRAIFEDTSDAQGDYARTSESAANQQKTLSANIENLKTTLGQALLPIFTKVVTFINEKVVPVFEEFSAIFEKEGLKGVLSAIGDKLPAIKDKLLELGGAFIEWITPFIPPLLEKLGEVTKALFDWVVEQAPGWAEKLLELGQALIDWIGPKIPGILQKLGELLVTVGNWIITEGLPLLGDKLSEWGDSFVEWIKPQIRPMLDKLGELLKDLGDWIITTALPKILEFSGKMGAKFIEWVGEVGPDLLLGLGELLVDLGIWFVTDALPKMQEFGMKLGLGLLDALWEALKDLGSGALDVGKSFVNAIVSFINTQVIDRLNDLFEFTIDLGVTSFTVNPPDIPHIPQLATGGIVSSPTLAVIGDRKLSQASNPEAVVPLNKMGDGGVVININGAVDPASTARQIRQLLQDDGRRLNLAVPVPR